VLLLVVVVLLLLLLRLLYVEFFAKEYHLVWFRLIHVVRSCLSTSSRSGLTHQGH
jgi:hypothetical protein